MAKAQDIGDRAVHLYVSILFHLMSLQVIAATGEEQGRRLCPWWVSAQPVDWGALRIRKHGCTVRKELTQDFHPLHCWALYGSLYWSVTVKWKWHFLLADDGCSLGDAHLKSNLEMVTCQAHQCGFVHWSSVWLVSSQSSLWHFVCINLKPLCLQV